MTKPRQFYCDRCGGLFNQTTPGRPRRYCDDCRGKPLPTTTVKIDEEEIPAQIEETAPRLAPLPQRAVDMHLSVVRSVAAGRPCHQEALDVLRRIGE